ncbi:hypothetical protein ACOME3_008237 [Neoechinorhynchus agilis]
MSVVLETTIGCVTIDLYYRERPICTFNFLKLCERGCYYLSRFHSLQPNFIVQTGRPFNPKNAGEDETGKSVFGMLDQEYGDFFPIERSSILKHNSIGTVSMVNDGTDRLGSQFLITLSPKCDYLDKRHCVFGIVSEDPDNVIAKFNNTVHFNSKTNEPIQDVRILYTVVLYDPFAETDSIWLDLFWYLMSDHGRCSSRAANVS